ncbi:MAG TPA: hypothetical protein GXX54_03765 [Clostridiales bacterium]|nr:hypothetical protein [Clostridiales bacterium]
MLGKLLKYEMKAGARMIPISYLATAAVFLVGLIARSLKIHQVTTATTILLFFAGIPCIIITLIYVIMRFHKGMFGNEGYLTQTLPVGKGQLLLSKLISSYIWMVASAAVFVAAWAGAMVVSNNLNIMPDIIDFVFGNSFAPLVIFIVVSSAVQLFAFLGELYFAISLANTRQFLKNNVVFSVVFFFVTNFAVSLLELAAMLLIPLGIKFTETGVVWTTKTMLGDLIFNMEAFTGNQPLLSGISIGVGSCFADLAAGIGLLLAAVWLLNHKTSVK